MAPPPRRRGADVASPLAKGGLRWVTLGNHAPDLLEGQYERKVRIVEWTGDCGKIDSGARCPRRVAKIMEELGSRVTLARKRLSRLLAVARWVWVANCVIALWCFAGHRYELATAAGYTSIMSLLVAACARRAARHLLSVERVIGST